MNGDGVDREGQVEDGVVVPLDRLNPETLRNLVVEFVTRDWSVLADAESSLKNKVKQVLPQTHQTEGRQGRVQLMIGI